MKFKKLKTLRNILKTIMYHQVDLVQKYNSGLLLENDQYNISHLYVKLKRIYTTVSLKLNSFDILKNTL